MSEVATADCDGCAEERPVQQLEEVALPSGHTVVCCPDCRYHAEKLAAPPAACEGCGDTYPVDALDRTPMPDGRELSLCPDCVEEAAAIHDARHAAEFGTGAGAGTTTSTAGSGGTAAASGSSSGGTAARTGDAGSRTASGSAAGSDDEATGRGGKPATRDNVCDQCGEFFSIELFRVETVDGRTELFCPDCKEEGVREGIVTDVQLRRSQAYQVLELDGGADEDEIRQAYLRRVKEVHPDRSDGTRSEFMLVKQAYERLTDD